MLLFCWPVVLWWLLWLSACCLPRLCPLTWFACWPFVWPSACCWFWLSAAGEAVVVVVAGGGSMPMLEQICARCVSGESSISPKCFARSHFCTLRNKSALGRDCGGGRCCCCWAAVGAPVRLQGRWKSWPVAGTGGAGAARCAACAVRLGNGRPVEPPRPLLPLLWLRRSLPVLRALRLVRVRGGGGGARHSGRPTTATGFPPSLRQRSPLGWTLVETLTNEQSTAAGDGLAGRPSARSLARPAG